MLRLIVTGGPFVDHVVALQGFSRGEFARLKKKALAAGMFVQATNIKYEPVEGAHRMIVDIKNLEPIVIDYSTDISP